MGRALAIEMAQDAWPVAASARRPEELDKLAVLKAGTHQPVQSHGLKSATFHDLFEPTSWVRSIAWNGFRPQ